MEKCSKCGVYPLSLPNGSLYCGACKTTCMNEQVWDEIMKPKPKAKLGQLIESLRDPIFTLNAICALSGDQGIKRLAVASLARLNALDVGPFFSDAELAAKVEARLTQLLQETKQ